MKDKRQIEKGRERENLKSIKKVCKANEEKWVSEMERWSECERELCPRAEKSLVARAKFDTVVTPKKLFAQFPLPFLFFSLLFCFAGKSAASATQIKCKAMRKNTVPSSSFCTAFVLSLMNLILRIPLCFVLFSIALCYCYTCFIMSICKCTKWRARRMESKKGRGGTLN